MALVEDGVWENDFNTRSPVEGAQNPLVEAQWNTAPTRELQASPTRHDRMSLDSGDRGEGPSIHDAAETGSTAATSTLAGDEPPLVQAGFDEGVLRSLTALDVCLLPFLVLIGWR